MKLLIEDSSLSRRSSYRKVVNSIALGAWEYFKMPFVHFTYSITEEVVEVHRRHVGFC